MNFAKKIITLAFLFIISDTECIGGSESRKSKFQEYSNHAFNFTDYLIQFASIYSSDSTSESCISRMGALRGIVNAGYILDSLVKLGGAIIKTGPIEKESVKAAISGYFRGKNFSKDMDHWKRAAHIASNRDGAEKIIFRKKICQYSWLTLNKLLPYVAHHIFAQDFSPEILFELSELYRQKFMYAMMNKQKAS